MTVSWHVGAILNEPLSETLRFAAWYLDAGADGLTLMFDNPQDPAIGVLGNQPKITCIPCTPEFWQARGLTQDTRFTKRQNAALTWVYGQQSCDWLLNVDADEFLYVAGGDVAGFLADIPADVETVRVETAEIVDHNGVGNVYRMAMERDAARRIYQDSIGLFGPRRQGLIGHSQGKSFTRSGLEGVSLRQHWPQRAAGGLKEQVVPAGPGAALLHHIGLDYDVWRSKLAWRIQSRGFTVPLSNRISEALGSPDAEGRLRALHADLHGVDAARLQRMREEGACLELDLSPDALVQRVLGAFPDPA